MEERDFFVEARAQRTSPLNCPFCKRVNDYSLTWLYRKKKTNLNVDRMDERDRARYEKAQSYMVLLDDHVNCAEEGCRRRFEVSGMKTMAFVTPEQLAEVSFGGDGRRDNRFRQQPQTRGQQQSRGQGGRGGGGQRREDFGNREGYGNRGGQGDRGRKQSGQGGQRRGDENRQGGQQGSRKGNNPQPYSPSQWNEQQGLRSPRGKRSDPTGPGGGWH